MSTSIATLHGYLNNLITIEWPRIASYRLSAPSFCRVMCEYSMQYRCKRYRLQMIKCSLTCIEALVLPTCHFSKQSEAKFTKEVSLIELPNLRFMIQLPDPWTDLPLTFRFDAGPSVHSFPPLRAAPVLGGHLRRIIKVVYRIHTPPQSAVRPESHDRCV